MAFSFASVQVFDTEAEETVVRKSINEPSEIKELINMNNSYRKPGEYVMSYRYNVKLVRDGCEFVAEYSDQSNIKVRASIREPCSLGVSAKLVYKKTTGKMHIKALSIVLGADRHMPQMNKDDIAEQISRVLAMFRHVRDIAPVVVGDKLKPTCKVAKELSSQVHRRTVREFAVYKEELKQHLNDFNVLEKLEL